MDVAKNYVEFAETKRNYCSSMNRCEDCAIQYDCMSCDGVFVRKSEADLNYLIAKMRLAKLKDDLAVYSTHEDEPTEREKLLDEAKRCVLGERNAAYGTPTPCHQLIAKLWSDYLDTDIRAEMVADMMILLKLARERNGNPKRDNYVDIAGYAACASEIIEDLDLYNT